MGEKPAFWTARASVIGYYRVVLGLTVGEFGLVTFIVLAIITARYFPALGQRLVLAVKGRADEAPPRPPER